MFMNKLILNFSKMVVRNSDKNLKFLFEMIFSDNFQFVINKRFNNAFVHCETFHVIISKIVIILFDVLHVTINILSNFPDKLTIKSIAMIRKKIVDVVMNINFP